MRCRKVQQEMKNVNWTQNMRCSKVQQEMKNNARWYLSNKSVSSKTRYDVRASSTNDTITNMINTDLWCICAARFPATACVLVLVLSSQRKMTINNVFIEWDNNPWSSVDMLFFTPWADNNALSTWNMHHGWKKRHKARIKSKFNVKFLNRKLTEHAEGEHHTMGTEGAENSHPHLCVIFDSLERRYLSIFQDLALGTWAK